MESWRLQFHFHFSYGVLRTAEIAKIKASLIFNAGLHLDKCEPLFFCKPVLNKLSLNATAWYQFIDIGFSFKVTGAWEGKNFGTHYLAQFSFHLHQIYSLLGCIGLINIRLGFFALFSVLYWKRWSDLGRKTFLLVCIYTFALLKG